MKEHLIVLCIVTVVTGAYLSISWYYKNKLKKQKTLKPYIFNGVTLFFTEEEKAIFEAKSYKDRRREVKKFENLLYKGKIKKVYNGNELIGYIKA